MPKYAVFFLMYTIYIYIFIEKEQLIYNDILYLDVNWCNLFLSLVYYPCQFTSTLLARKKVYHPTAHPWVQLPKWCSNSFHLQGLPKLSLAKVVRASNPFVSGCSGGVIEALWSGGLSIFDDIPNEERVYPVIPVPLPAVLQPLRLSQAWGSMWRRGGVVALGVAWAWPLRLASRLRVKTRPTNPAYIFMLFTYTYMYLYDYM